MSNITKEEFERAMQLRSKDFEMQQLSISHDKDRLRILEKQCDYKNRFADICERLVSTKFLVCSYLLVVFPLIVGYFVRG